MAPELRAKLGALALGIAAAIPGGSWAGEPLSELSPWIVGDAPGSRVGASVSVGDLDGDLVDDLVVGAPGCDLGALDAGCVAVFYGGAWPWTPSLALADADVLILGAEVGEGLGERVRLGGDVDGDQIPDLVLAAPGYDGNGWERGRVAVFFGGPPLLPATTSVDAADVLIEGARDGSGLGSCLDSRRDLGGDGQPDLLLGAAGAPDGDGDALGAVFVLPGQGAWPPALTVDVDASDALFGARPDTGFGTSCAAVEDQDGDGVAEVLVGAPDASRDDQQPALPAAGEVFLIRGGDLGEVDHGGPPVLSSWRAIQPFHYLGNAVCDAGDLDDSGAGDVAFSALGADAVGPATGAVYLFLHDGAGVWSAGEAPESTATVIMDGELTGGWAGGALAGVGDVDGDGIDDLAVAAPLVGGVDPEQGRLYLVAGDGALAGPALPLASAFAAWDGASGQRVADAVAAGDLAGHGWRSIAIGVERDGGGSPPAGGLRVLSLPDLDGDGFCPEKQCAAGLQALDCDDADPDSYPGAPEVPYDGVDQDCDGADWVDQDGDGAAATEAGGNDCDDLDPGIHPGATEILCDGIDQNCSGVDLTDGDGDGYDAPACGGDDCDDADPAVHPGASEIANGLDDDCDGPADEGTVLFDDDGDGYCEGPGPCSDSTLEGDCDDEDPAVHPGATEVLNALDDDCDGLLDDGTPAYDDDGDGYSEFGGDCDDADPEIHPGHEELHDGIDNDCDGLVDEEPPAPVVDLDGDGYCPSLVACDDGTAPGDCDDTDPNAFPGAAEVAYDGVDQDCDGADRTDIDGDGYDAEQVGGLDCDDADADVHPGRVDLEDGVDQDCDGEIDEDAADYASRLGGGCICGSDGAGRTPAAAALPLLLLASAAHLRRRRRA